MYELNPGVIDGMTQEEIKGSFIFPFLEFKLMKLLETYPKEFEIAQKEPYKHRYPRAESYHDLSVRLEPIIIELEREPSDVVLIGSASVIRCLMAYLGGLSPEGTLFILFLRVELMKICRNSKCGIEKG